MTLQGLLEKVHTRQWASIRLFRVIALQLLKKEDLEMIEVNGFLAIHKALLFQQLFRIKSDLLISIFHEIMNLLSG